MRFDVADDDIHAERLLFARGLEHGVGLAHPGGHAEEELQFSALLLAFLPLDGLQQLVRVGSHIIVHALIDSLYYRANSASKHQLVRSCRSNRHPVARVLHFIWSSARFSFNTFTPGIAQNTQIALVGVWP